MDGLLTNVRILSLLITLWFALVASAFFLFAHIFYDSEKKRPMELRKYSGARTFVAIGFAVLAAGAFTLMFIALHASPPQSDTRTIVSGPL